MGFGETVLRIVGAILALALVLLLAWLVLRWMNRRIPGAGPGSGRAIKILDRVAFGRNSSILLMRVQDKVILVAVNEHAIEKLYEFDDPDEKFQLPQPSEGVNFTDALKEAASKFGLGNKNNGPGKGGEK